jgi:hypothetical protein
VTGEIPTCPQCESPLHFDSAACGACGLTLASLDEHFGEDCVVLDRVTDAAHVLRRHEKDAVVEEIGRFERCFPQLFFSVYIGALPPARGSLRLFGFWLLNRAAVTAVDFTRPNENGALLLVDVRACALSLTLGYYLEPLFRGKQLTSMLERARPFLATGDFSNAVIHVLKEFSRQLRKRVRRKSSTNRSNEAVPLRVDGIEQLPRLRHRRRDDIQR